MLVCMYVRDVKTTRQGEMRDGTVSLEHGGTRRGARWRDGLRAAGGVPPIDEHDITSQADDKQGPSPSR